MIRERTQPKRFHRDDLIGYAVAVGFYGGVLWALVATVIAVRCLLLHQAVT